jgi:hypothetical protein
VLRSARGLGAWGSRVEGIEPERGWSVRGTADDKLFRGDVVRTRWVQMAQQAALSPPVRRPHPEPRVGVNVRARAARRAVTQAVEDAAAAARAHQGAAHLLHGDNQHVGGALLQYARVGRGRRRHLLDTTPGAGP